MVCSYPIQGRLVVLDMLQSVDIEDVLLCVINYQNEFERVHHVNAGESRIGRADDSEIWLLDQSVSRKHASLCWSGDRVTIRDEGSRNGTSVNGILIGKNEIVLDKGSEIEIGPYQLLICFKFGEALLESPDLVGTNETTHTNPCGTKQKLTRRQLPTLTEAQQRVYEGFVEGLSEKEIAYRLKIKPNTVHSHAKAIYKQLEVSSRGELLKFWADQNRFP